MVETLYGVMHGKFLEIGGMHVADFNTSPGKELVSELLSLPQNTSVGIEHTPELEGSFGVDGQIRTTNGSAYWADIKQICEQQHLKVVYLEDFPTYQKYARKVMEKNGLDEENLKDHMRFLDKNPNGSTAQYEGSKSARTIIRKAYKAGVEAEYILTIEREQKMLDRIAEQKPQVVILGKGHSDYLFLKPEELVSRNIPLDKYKTEEWDEYSSGTPHLIQDPIPDKTELLSRELLIRRYRAVTEGRIISNGTPNYIGTWDLTIPARGLFEIYLDNKNGGMTGRIEDILGTANFMGRIAGNKAIFDKRYDPLKSSSEAVEESLMYEASGADGLYTGNFKVVSGYKNDREIPFVMRKFTPSVKLNLV